MRGVNFMIENINVSNITCKHIVNNGGGLLKKIQGKNNKKVENTT